MTILRPGFTSVLLMDDGCTAFDKALAVHGEAQP
jgi:hypothetical protein